MRTTVNITDFINDDVKEYSKYVLYSRAIPSLIDGLKPSQRKILWTAIKSARDKNIKTASLTGNVISMANYHHGDASLNEAISGMAQDFKNNAPLLKGEGSFGSRAIPVAAAARYTFVKLSSAYKTYFADTDIAPESYDLEDPEPKYYLPLIPWVLVNGIKGIAVGFATEIQPRSIKVIKKTCQDYMKGKNIDKMKLPPHYPFFAGTFEEREDGVFECVGTYEQVGKKLHITEIPIGYDREKYIKILDGLVDKGVIVRYIERKSKTKGFNFEVILRNKTKMTHKQIEGNFRLRKAMNENITVIDENGKLKIFDSVIDLIKHFCDFRLEQYPTRYEKLINEADEKIRFKKEKIRFIDLVNRKRIDMKASLRIIKKAWIGTEGGNSEAFSEDDGQKLVNMPLYHLSKDKVDELEVEINDHENDVKRYSTIDFQKQYITELGAL